MGFVRVVFTLMFGVLLLNQLWSQPMAYLESTEVDHYEEADFSTPKTTISNKDINTDSKFESANDEELVLEVEDYLQRLMWNQDWGSLTVRSPSYYKYLTPYLQTLESEYGSDPFYLSDTFIQKFNF